jgi:hypothetical protein
MKLTSAILLVMSGALFAQTNTNNPTDTPTVRALTALLPLRDQANYGRWLAAQGEQAKFAGWVAAQGKQAEFASWLEGQAYEAKFAGWVAAQTQNVGKARFVAALGNPELLLQVREDVNRPNYGGNALEAKRKALWLETAKGHITP